MSDTLVIEPEWKEILNDYVHSNSFSQLTHFVKNEYLSKTVYPHPKDIFKAFWLTPFSKVQVVILGQDPYHGEQQAHGMSFSVPDGIRVPPSLQNIYKEIENDLHIKKDFTNGNLSSWAQQGVFLLNALLSVVAHRPLSHKKQGWEAFTDHVIQMISEKKEHVVFLLWGSFAKSKKPLIDTTKHLVLEATHPSPFSAHSGFFGCQHFSQTNSYLKKHNKKEIQW